MAPTVKKQYKYTWLYHKKIFQNASVNRKQLWYTCAEVDLTDEQFSES